MTLKPELINELKKIVGSDWVVTNRELIERYLYDETSEEVRPKAAEEVVVVKTKTAEEVSEVLKLANREGVPVYPRGGGTGLVGGAVPTKPGIVLSLERMDDVVIDTENLVAEVGAGVTLSKLIEEAEGAGLFFPPHPGDEGAFIGGMIATNAGGARAVRTGVMRNYVLGIEVVIPTGQILRLGGKVIKNNMGYNLMHLIIGSEGTLGVITKACIRLYPKYGASATMVIPFNSRLDAINTSYEIMGSGVTPLLLEYAEKGILEKSANYLGLKWPAEEGTAHLIVTVSKALEDSVYGELEIINSIAEKHGALEPVVATRDDEQAEILKIRSEIYSALKKDMVDALDVSLPLGKIYEFMEGIDELEGRYGTWIPICGHVGDGNLHPHILRKGGWGAEMYEKLKNDIYDLTMRLGGSITGEHGVGATRTKYMLKYLSKEYIQLMRELKKLFDPNNILNPGKVIPEV